MNLIKINDKYYLSKESNKYYGIAEFSGLKFTSIENNSSVGYTITGTPTGSDMKYSYDSYSWNDWDGTSIILNNNEFIYVKGDNPNGLNKSGGYITFTTSGKICASGNINSLLDNNNGNTITTIPNNYCYDNLFYECRSLITPPELPAINLKTGCYMQMFYQCSSLTNMPELPATTLVTDCYRNMFVQCTNLSGICVLPATILASNCYNGIFFECKTLNNIKIYYTGVFDSSYFYNWVNKVSSSGDFYYNGSDTSRGSSAIPSDWTIHTF